MAPTAQCRGGGRNLLHNETATRQISAAGPAVEIVFSPKQEIPQHQQRQKEGNYMIKRKVLPGIEPGSPGQSKHALGERGIRTGSDNRYTIKPIEESRFSL